MVFVMISKTGKTVVVESNTKMNAKYYCNVLLKNMISEMNSLEKRNEYLFMQDWDRANTFHLLKFRENAGRMCCCYLFIATFSKSCLYS